MLELCKMFRVIPHNNKKDASKVFCSLFYKLLLIESICQTINCVAYIQLKTSFTQFKN